MASRAHRWKGDDTPLTGVHGGSAAAAHAAVKESKRLLYERAHAAVQEVIARNRAASEGAPRQDRLRPRAGRLAAYPPTPGPYLCTPPVTVRRAPPECAPRSTVPTEVAVWEKCGGICVYCQRHMVRWGVDPQSFTIDHDTPRSRGGSNRLSNLVGACSRCNNEKGSLTGGEYRAVLAYRAARGIVTEGEDPSGASVSAAN